MESVCVGWQAEAEEPVQFSSLEVQIEPGEQKSTNFFLYFYRILFLSIKSYLMQRENTDGRDMFSRYLKI